MVSMETIWTIIGVLLVQFATGGMFYAGYRTGLKSKRRIVAPLVSAADEEERKRMEQVGKAFKAVLTYDLNTAMRRTNNA